MTRGKVVLKKQLRRNQMATFFVNLPPCLIGMEACGSAHHWARKLQGMGHTVRLMAPQFVKPYVKTNKNDAVSLQRKQRFVTLGLPTHPTPSVAAALATLRARAMVYEQGLLATSQPHCEKLPSHAKTA